MTTTIRNSNDDSQNPLQSSILGYIICSITYHRIVLSVLFDPNGSVRLAHFFVYTHQFVLGLSSPSESQSIVHLMFLCLGFLVLAYSGA